MNYQSDLDLGELNKKRQLLDDPRKMVILVGNYEKSILDRNRVWSRDPRKVREHMETSMAFGKGGAGAALYVYKYLSDDQISQLKLMWAGQ
jgi:hypothetical protein